MHTYTLHSNSMCIMRMWRSRVRFRQQTAKTLHLSPLSLSLCLLPSASAACLSVCLSLRRRRDRRNGERKEVIVVLLHAFPLDHLRLPPPHPLPRAAPASGPWHRRCPSTSLPWRRRRSSLSPPSCLLHHSPRRKVRLSLPLSLSFFFFLVQLIGL